MTSSSPLWRVIASLAVFVGIPLLFALNDWFRGRTGAPKVKIRRAICYGLHFIPRAWKNVPGPILLCIGLGVAELAWAAQFGEGDLVRVAITALVLIAELYAYGACYRLALETGDASPRLRLGRFGFQFGAVEKDLVQISFLTALIAMGVLLAFAAAGVLIMLPVRAVASGPLSDTIAALIVGLAVGAFVYLVARFYPTLPAAAALGSGALSEGWRLGRGAVFAALAVMLANLFLLLVLLTVVVMIAYAARFDVRQAGGLVTIAVAAALPFNAGLTSYFYLALSRKA